MSKENKKKIRKKFRDECFSRDNYCCVMCGFNSSLVNAESELDCHHITSRTELPAGGYVMENGISLCSECHIKAETYYSTGVAEPGFSPFDLYRKIGSTYELALEASKKLERK